MFFHYKKGKERKNSNLGPPDRNRSDSHSLLTLYEPSRGINPSQVEEEATVLSTYEE